MSDIPKRRFAFQVVEGRVDLYLDGKKVINGHRGETGNFYFRIPEDVEVKFDVAEHDPNIPIEAEVTAEGLKPIERRPKFVTEGLVHEQAKQQVEIELKAKAAQAEKERIMALRAEREAELQRRADEKAAEEEAEKPTE